ncbi:DUF2510 domain-containing protein [Nostocoides sp. Soil756]|jgi:hypothetical protein|uniref:DUF2510 domain-containing protein n=1 Tax=Nostocoides sp. Soil756 TaxID=1736399 RepID=UPI0007022B0B|nr:DUF2510 domain-containing protein [Tetrasphaera sp. Soil756]KRE63477.1 hypothetical protein ASG78_00785 [Tetrasphaera sp. Soil756]
MSAPPGWHPQPDGRERWWDGQQWTEHLRDPAATPPAAAGVEAPYGTPGAYGQPAWQPPQRRGMSGGAKGCLIAVGVLLLLLVVGAVVAVVLFARNVSTAVDDARSAFPTSLPTQLPSELPTGATTVTVRIGEGFPVGDAQVEDGWSLGEAGSFGRPVEGMRVTGGDGQPVFFTMRFTGGGADAETVCTATGDTTSDAGRSVTCVPIFGDVPDDSPVQVTSAL